MRCHLLVLTLVLALPATAHAQAQTRQCPRVAPGARCVTLTVPLDHTGATPGTQRLGFAVLPSTGHSVGALAVLAGGPGQAATSIGKRVSGLLAGVRRTHDLLLVDQRGTGLSGELRCPGLATSESVRAVTRCGESLGSARAFYTARDDAYDLDAIRAAVGVEKMSVLGISSGGRVAGVYARLFGDHLSRLVLDSPEPVEGADALMTLRQLALPRVLREVCWPPSCRGFLAADPLKGLATLAARLAKTSLSGTVITPAGRPKKARLSATGLYALTSMSDLDPFVRTQLPWAVAAALRGDEAPLLRL